MSGKTRTRYQTKLAECERNSFEEMEHTHKTTVHSSSTCEIHHNQLVLHRRTGADALDAKTIAIVKQAYRYAAVHGREGDVSAKLTLAGLDSVAVLTLSRTCAPAMVASQKAVDPASVPDSLL